MKCYVSGKTSTVSLYNFGAEVHLPLAQEVFAKFILLAGEDEEHLEIMERVKAAADKADDLKDRVATAVLDYEACIPGDDPGQIQLEFREADHALLGVLVEKSRSGLRLLAEIRKEYEPEAETESEE